MKARHFSTTSVFALSLCAFAAVARAQNTTPSTWGEPFAFAMPWDDGAPGFVDASFLNTSRAGANGFIVARGGHFVEANTNRRVRFVGINSTFDTSFPDKADAPKMAARLAKAGFNVVRFHYMDGSYYGRSTIWDESKKDFRHLDAAQLDRLDFFIAELQKRGIYANLNLHVARKFSPADGFADSVKDITFDFDKRVDFFSPRMIELQKEYARALLSHRNPYTRRVYANDPGVLCVEITNEDSARWFDDGDALPDLPQPFAGELKARQQQWLQAKRPNAEASLTQVKNGELGAELLLNANQPGGWAPETSGGAAMEITPAENGLRVRVGQKGGANWSAQLHQKSLSLQGGQSYTLKMRARSKDSRPFAVSMMLDEPDWHGLGLSRTAKTTPEWKDFEWVFESPETINGKARLSIQLGDAVGEVEMQAISLRAGGQSPTLGLARRDWLEFLTDLEVKYADEMRGFLRRELGVKSMVTCSQVDYGGLTGIFREAGSDFTDKHEYWDHPATPEGWNTSKLIFQNKSMVPELNGGTLTSAANWRIEGRPFVISEYNHPFPNEFDAECVPLLALGAAWQDWDAIYFHEWGFSPFNDKAGPVKISNPFTMWNAVSKMAFLPPMSILFRTAQVSPAPGQAPNSMPLARDGEALGRSIQSLWSGIWKGPELPVWGAQRSLSGPGTPNPRRPFIFRRIGTDHKVEWSDGKHNAPAHLIVDAGSVQVLAGALGNRQWSSSRIKLRVGACPNDFAVATLCAMDGKPLESSPRVLLSIVSRIQNTTMQFRADRKNLPDWGRAPVLVEVPALDVELQTRGPRRVQVLDATGKAVREVASSYQNGTLKFSTSARDKTVWYSISPR